VSPDPFLDECFIKKPVRRNPVPSNTVTSNTVPSNTVTTSVIPFEKIVNSNTSNTNTSNTIDLDISDGDDEIVEEEVAEEQDGLTSSSNLDDFINETANELTRNNQILSKGLEENTQINTTYQNSNANDNIVLEIEDLSPEPIKIEDTNILKEVDLSPSLENNLESITLKKPNQVYYEIYKKAREKAKECKKVAIAAYLEAKNIKNTYMLEDNDESDSDESELDDFDKYENEDEE